MKSIKKRILWTVVFVALVVAGCREKQLSYEEKNREVMMDWFGYTMIYSVEVDGVKEEGVAFSSFDPEKLATLLLLETDGLAAMGEWDEAFTSDVIALIEKEKDVTDQKKERCLSMINGGYHTIDIVGDTYTVEIDMLDFLEAVVIIEEKMGNVNKNVMPEGIYTTYFR